MRPRKRVQAPVHRSVYWDACIYIAWLKNEQRPPGEMEGTLESAAHVLAGRSTLVVSSIMDGEVLKLEADARLKLTAFLKRRNIITIGTEPPISGLARELREHYLNANTGLKSLELADAFHLATAINREVEAFYTFDRGKKGGLDLLSLSGNVAGYPLLICKPPFSQYLIFH